MWTLGVLFAATQISISLDGPHNMQYVFLFKGCEKPCKDFLWKRQTNEYPRSSGSERAGDSDTRCAFPSLFVASRATHVYEPQLRRDVSTTRYDCVYVCVKRVCEKQYRT